MKPRRHAFDFKISIHGASVVVAKAPLTSAAMSDGEVDWQIAALKNDLDAIAVKMKAAIRAQEKQPLFLSYAE